MDDLLGLCLDAAQDRLESGGVLVPFAVVLDADGEPSMRAALGRDETDDAQGSVTDLVEGLRSERGQLRGAGLVVDVSLEGGDAVQVLLEHADPAAPALALALPYVRKRRRFQYGDLAASTGTRRIWD